MENLEQLKTNQNSKNKIWILNIIIFFQCLGYFSLLWILLFLSQGDSQYWYIIGYPITGIIILLPFIFLKTNRNNITLGHIISIITLLILVTNIYSDIKYKIDTQKFIIQDRSFIQQKNDELLKFIQKPILITDYNGKEVPVLMTNKGFAIYLHPEAQNYKLFEQFVQTNIIGKNLTVVLQGPNSVVGDHPSQVGAFNPLNNFGTSRAFSNAEFGCYCDIQINGELLNEMKFPD